jgi:hypothetical protein
MRLRPVFLLLAAGLSWSSAATPSLALPSSAPAETSNLRWASADHGMKAAWLADAKSLLHADLSEHLEPVVLATLDAESTFGAPASVLLRDGQSLLCFWTTRDPQGSSHEHAGGMARSEDGGRTWRREDRVLGESFSNFAVPHGHYSTMTRDLGVFALANPQGEERLWVVAPHEILPGGARGEYLPRLLSKDGGRGWERTAPLGGTSKRLDPVRWPMYFTSMIRLFDGSVLATYEGYGQADDQRPSGKLGALQALQTISYDEGLTWATPTILCDGLGVGDNEPSAPYVFRSPDGRELACLMHQQNDRGPSLVAFSQDEGRTWTAPRETAWGLSGRRHAAVTLPDGRLFVTMEDKAPWPESFREAGIPVGGGLFAWVGTYQDLRQGRPGQGRLRLVSHLTGRDPSPGLHLLADGTVVAVTRRTPLASGPRPTEIVSLRISPKAIDEALESAQRLR